MRKRFHKLICLGLIAAMIVSGNTLLVNADDLGGILPAAGTARVLSEGISVTAVQAEKIKSSRGVEEDTQEQSSVVKDAQINMVLAGAGESIVFSAKTATDKNKEKTADGATVTAKMIAVNEPAVSTADSSEPELITVGGASTAGNGTVAPEPVVIAVDGMGGAGSAVLVSAESSDDDQVLNLVDVVTHNKQIEDEDFTNLVIANVNDYVNVRDAASESGNIIGKLYDKSVGDLIEEEGDWYKIKSGSVTGYVKGEYCVTGEDAQNLAKEVGKRMAVVTTTTLYVRSEPSKEAEVLGMVPIEDQLEVLAEMDGWVKVSIEEGDGFVSSEFVRLYTDFVRAESKEEEEARLAKEEAAREAARKAAAAAGKNKGSKKQQSSGGAAPAYVASGSGTGSEVANYALQFVGNPYVYGGSSLTNGTDCSGFVMSVYRNFGVSLPHSSGADRGVGYGVPGGIANAQAGDIVCYSGHVGIYIGGGQIVHASTARTGIKVSPVSYRSVLAVRRIF